jgi:protein transport protein SEC23
MQDEVILLLDSYFVVLLWYGQSIRNWEQNGYHEMEGYEHIRDLMNAPNEDIDYIVSTRFPTPNFYKTFPSHPKERYLKSKVNPKKTGEENENLITDDTNIKAFTECLIKLVVTQPLN